MLKVSTGRQLNRSAFIAQAEVKVMTHPVDSLYAAWAFLLEKYSDEI
jgi:hypothetical protein